MATSRANRNRRRCTLAGAALALLFTAWPPGAPADAIEPWWEAGAGPGWTAVPSRGGFLVTWDPRTAPELELAWPPDPDGLPGRLLAHVDGGSAGSVALLPVGPGHWAVDASWAILIRRPKDRIGAFAGFVEPHGDASLLWRREVSGDPLATARPGLVLRRGSASSPLRVWLAEGREPEALWIAWNQAVIHHAARRPRRPRRPPPAPAVRGPAPLGGGLASPGGAAADVAAVVVAADPLDRLGSGERDAFLGVLRSDGLDLIASGTVLSVDRPTARRLPFDAVFRGGHGTLHRHPLRPTLSGRRAAARGARTGAMGDVGAIAAEGLEDAYRVDPGTYRMRLTAFASGLGERTLRLEDGPTLESLGLAGSLPLVRLEPGRPVGAAVLWSLAWRAPLQGHVGRLHTGVVGLGTGDNEERLRTAVASLAGADPHLAWIGPPGAKAREALRRLLPATGRGASAVDLFLTDPEDHPYPNHFVLNGEGRDVHVFFNLEDHRTHQIVRIPPAIPAEDGNGRYLVYDTVARTVRGVFSPGEPVGLAVPAGDARTVVAVSDRDRPYLAATGSHWTEGMHELVREIWLDRAGILELVLARRAGYAGMLAVIGDTAPVSIEATGGSAGPITFERRGPRPLALVPVAWEADTLRVRIRFPEPGGEP